MFIPSTYVPSGTFHPKRYRPGGIGNWSGHLPFANDLIRNVRPQLLVELGTHYGESYFGFCQAVSEHNVPCACYAVDTWMGEAHAGYYGEEVYAEVNSYNEANYDKFSYLLRTTFDDALSQFAQDSIDILHIDGLHTYEAVAHDVYGWLPKVKPGGIVLLHDIKTRHGDFGVWKLWEDLKCQGETFEFEHSWGLGVFRKAGLAAPCEGLLGILFGDSDEMKAHLRRFYELCATELQYLHKGNDAPYERQTVPARLQIFLPSAAGYSEEDSHLVEVQADNWQRVDVELVSGIKGSLRIDLTDCPSIIEVAGLVIRALVSDSILWTASGSDFSAFSLGGTIVRLGVSQSGNACRFFSFGNDAQLILPDLNSETFDQPLRIQIWLRVHTEFSALVPLLEARNSADVTEGVRGQSPQDLTGLRLELAQIASERDAFLARQKQSEIDASRVARDYGQLRQEQESLAIERQKLLAEQSKAQKQIFLFKTEAKQGRKELENTRSELMQVRVSYDACREHRLELENRVASLRSDLADKEAALQRLETALQQMASSRSMRITAPVRAVGRLFKLG